MSTTTHSFTSSGGSRRFSCPCQRIPLSLSSATSAEYGDVASLARRMKNNNNTTSSSNNNNSVSMRSSSGGTNSNSSIPGGISNGGITPLHLAAQHGHPAAVNMLLKEGGFDVDTGLLPTSSSIDNTGQTGDISGATPLHRAAFSGAISPMQILLSWGTNIENDNGSGTNNKRRANLLARDTSFGDKKTPLHKAVAGGRPLAVQLLINTLQKRELLQEALQAEESSGLTPLQLAKQFTSMNGEELEVERQSVRRWDVVAGGDCADWTTCLRLLDGAASSSLSSSIVQDSYYGTTSSNEQVLFNFSKKKKDAVVPALSELDNVANSYCEDDECVDGRCRTSVWESAFRMALSSSMKMALNNGVCIPISDQSNEGGGKGEKHNDRATTLTTTSNSLEVTSAVISDTIVPNATQTAQTNDTKQIGRQCDSCGKYSPALFRSVNHQLVCKQCRRLAKSSG